MFKKLIVFMALAMTFAFTIVSCEEDSTTEVAWYPIIRGTIAENNVDVTKNVKVEVTPSGLTNILTISGLGGTEDNKEWIVEFKLDADPDNRLREYSTDTLTDGLKLRYSDTDPAGLGTFEIDCMTSVNLGGTAILTLQEYEEGVNILAKFDGDIFTTDGSFSILELELGLLRTDVFE